MSPVRDSFVCHDPQGDWISDLEREDEERRRRHEEAQDPWGYDDPPPEQQEPREDTDA